MVFLGEVSTHDEGLLTRMVVAAYDENVKLTIGASGPGRIRVEFRPLRRHGPERYPTMADAVALARREQT